ncbi:unnamed protein product, partial [Notodromas monacha]
DRYKVDLSVMHGNRLPLLLTSLKGRTWFPGITSPFYFLGARGTAFAMHCEDMDLVSINLSLGGYPKIWYGIPMEHLAQYEAVLKLHLGAGACDVPARHKHFLFAEGFLHKYGIKPVVAVQHPWEMIVTFPKGHHGGFNTGFNWNVAVNFAPEFWVDYGIAAVNCSCETVVNIRFSMEPFVQRLQPSMYKDWLFGKMTQTPDEWTQRRDLRACGLSNKHVKTPTLSDLKLTKIPRTKAAWALAEDVSPTEVHLLRLLQERIKFLDGKVTDLLGRGPNKPDTVSCDLLDVIQEEAENRMIRRLQGAMLKDRYKVDLSVMHGNRLPLLLTSLKGRTWFPGITSPFYFLGARGTAFAMHCEDMDLVLINLSLGGYPKIWYGIPMEHLAQYEAILKLHLGAGACDVPARHKHFLFAEVVRDSNGTLGAVRSSTETSSWCRTAVNIRFSMEPFVRRLRPSMYKDWLMGKMTQTPDEWTQRRDLRACGLSNKHVKTPTLSDLKLTKIPRTEAAWALAEDVSPTEVHLLRLLQERIKFLDGKVTDLLGRGPNKPDTVSCDLLDDRIDKHMRGSESSNCCYKRQPSLEYDPIAELYKKFALYKRDGTLASEPPKMSLLESTPDCVIQFAKLMVWSLEGQMAMFAKLMRKPANYNGPHNNWTKEICTFVYDEGFVQLSGHGLRSWCNDYEHWAVPKRAVPRVLSESQVKFPNVYSGNVNTDDIPAKEKVKIKLGEENKKVECIMIGTNLEEEPTGMCGLFMRCDDLKDLIFRVRLHVRSMLDIDEDTSNVTEQVLKKNQKIFYNILMRALYPGNSSAGFLDIADNLRNYVKKRGRFNLLREEIVFLQVNRKQKTIAFFPKLLDTVLCEEIPNMPSSSGGDQDVSWIIENKLRNEHLFHEDGKYVLNDFKKWVYGIPLEAMHIVGGGAARIGFEFLFQFHRKAFTKREKLSDDYMKNYPKNGWKKEWDPHRSEYTGFTMTETGVCYCEIGEEEIIPAFIRITILDGGPAFDGDDPTDEEELINKWNANPKFRNNTFGIMCK